MKRLLLTLAAVGLAAGLSAGPSSAAILFTYQVAVNAPTTYGDPFPAAATYASNLAGGLATYTIIPDTSTSSLPFLANDATAPGADIVLAHNQLFIPPGTPSSNLSSFDAPFSNYTINLTLYKDDNPADFANFAVTGNITTLTPVHPGGGTTGNNYTLITPVTVFSALSSTPFTLTRLDFTFPTSPPVAGGPGTIGAYSAHISSAVPEPGPVALFASILVAGSGIMFRRRRAI